jgi:hypothetical protein
MAKYFQRLGTTKANFLVQIKIIAIEADVKEHTMLSVQWIRGPSKEETSAFNIDVGEGSKYVNQSF